METFHIILIIFFVVCLALSLGLGLGLGLKHNTPPVSTKYVTIGSLEVKEKFGNLDESPTFKKIFNNGSEIFCHNNLQNINIDFTSDIEKILKILNVNVSNTIYAGNMLLIPYENFTGISDKDINSITSMLLGNYGEDNIVEIVGQGIDEKKAVVSINIMDTSKIDNTTMFENEKLFGTVPLYTGKKENLDKMLQVCKGNFMK